MFNFYIKHHWFITFFGAFLLLVLSLIPSGPVNPLSWIQLLHIDKIAHVLAYSIWCFALLFSFYKQYKEPQLRYSLTLLPFFIAFVYGVIMELLQHTISADRVGEWPDVIANATGCLLGLLVFFGLKNWTNQKLNTYEKSQNTSSKH